MILVTKTSDQTRQRVCVCVCVVIPFILDVRFVDAPAGVTQDFSTFHLRTAVLALIFTARGIQPSLSLVDREVEFILCTHKNNRSSLVGHFFYFW